MATIKKRTTKPVGKTASKPTAKPSPDLQSSGELINTGFAVLPDTVSVKVKRGGAYGVWGIEMMQSMQVPEDSTSEETLDNLSTFLTDKIDAYVQANFPSEEEEEAEEEAEEEEAEEEAEEEELTETKVRLMNRPQLLQVLEDYETDINPKELKKLAELRDAVADALFPSEEEEEAEEEGEEEGEEEELTEDSIREMTKPELLSLIKEYDLEVDPKKYKKLSLLAEAVIEALPSEEEEEAEEEGEEEAEEVEITEELVREMDRSELLDLIKEYDLEVDPKKYRKTEALTNAVVDALFVDDDGVDSEFDDVDFGDDD